MPPSLTAVPVPAQWSDVIRRLKAHGIRFPFSADRCPWLLRVRFYMTNAQN